MKDLLENINRLARKAKTSGLTEEEKKEQDILRKEYLKIFRGKMEDTLMTVKVLDPEGKDITPKKLLEEQKKREENKNGE